MQQLKHCLPSGLLCLSTAKEGGLTSWSSSGSIYNRLLQSHPDYVQVCISSAPKSVSASESDSATERKEKTRRRLSASVH